MRILRVTFTVWLAMLAAAALAQDCGPRVRKAWRMLSADEKRVYKEAIASALSKNEFFEFTKIHVHRMSEKQAHNTCAFLIWHKRFLLGFENMLRAQTPESRCITVPYWDAMTEYAQMVDGQCKSIYDCAPIVRELGGEPKEEAQTVTIAGRAVKGQCYPGFPGYCDDAKQVCGCVPRGDLKTKGIPATAGFQGLFDQIAFSNDFEAFTKGIQAGIHNDMHSQLGGFMSTFYSPNDMLFWSWHATIDMLLYVYHQCHLAEAMSVDEMKKSAYAFSQDGDCKYSDDAPDAVVNGQLLQMSEYQGAEYKAADNPVIGRYFQGLSADVSAMLGFRTLGDHSYTYEIPEAFKKFLLLKHDLCPAFAEAVGAPDPSPPAATPPPSGDAKGQPVSDSPSLSPAPSPAAEHNETRGFSDAEGGYDPGTVRPKETAVPPSPPTDSPTPAPSQSSPPPVPYPEVSEPPKDGAYDSTTSPPSPTPSPIPNNSGDGPDVGDDDEEYKFNGDGSLRGGYGSYEHTLSLPPRPHPSQLPSPSPTPTPAAASTAAPTSTPPPTPPPTTAPPPTMPPTTPPPTTPGPPAVVVDIDKSLITMNENDESLKTQKYWEWVSNARSNLERVFPGNHSEIASQLQYLECMSYNDQYGVQDYSPQFIKEFHLNDAAKKPSCVQKIDQVQQGQKEIVVQTTSFEAKSVGIKEGVTPAPPVPPAPRPHRQYRVVASNTLAPQPVEGPTAYAPAARIGSLSVLFAALLSALWLN